MKTRRGTLGSVVAIGFALSLGFNSGVGVTALAEPNPTIESRDEQRRMLGKLDREDKAAAVKLARQLSDEGDPMAMAYLGASYLDGSNVPKDRAAAEALFEKASAAGDAETDLLIGKTFARCRCEGNKEAAFAWYSRAALRGHPMANFDLGGMYELGFGVPVDPAKAFAQFLKAAELGYPRAMSKVAECYSKGLGVEKNGSLAQEWSSRASAAAVVQAVPKK